jgi:hypothetical protein
MEDDFDPDQITRWRIMKFTFVQIAGLLNLPSTQRLSRWRTRTGWEDPRTRISDAQLDNLVFDIQENQPGRGERIAAGMLY